MSEKIRIFDLKYGSADVDQFLNGAQEILAEGFLTNHKFVGEFEAAFARQNQSPTCVAVCNGTAALEIAFRAIGVKGKKVILPTNTFIATAYAVLRAGGTPVLVDIENSYFGICPQQLEKTLFQLRGQVAAVCHVHIGGHVSTLFPQVLKQAKEYGLPVVEDSCHTLGARLNGIFSGNFSEYGAFSFFTTKVLSAGEGGMVVTSTANRKHCQSLRQFGMDLTNPLLHNEESSNFKMSEFTALLALIDLRRLAQRIEKRRLLAQRYQQRLMGSRFRCVTDSAESYGSYYKQIVLCEDLSREVISSHLASSGVALTGGVYHEPLHRQPVMKNFATPFEFSNSERFAQSHFCPPCYPELSVEQVDRVCDLLLQLD